VEFLKFYGFVLLCIAPCAAVGLGLSFIPTPVVVIGAFALLGLAIYHYRNRSLV